MLCGKGEPSLNMRKGSKLSSRKLGGKSQFNSATKEETVVGIIRNKGQCGNSPCSVTMINP